MGAGDAFDIGDIGEIDDVDNGPHDVPQIRTDLLQRRRHNRDGRFGLSLGVPVEVGAARRRSPRRTPDPRP